MIPVSIFNSQVILYSHVYKHLSHNVNFPRLRDGIRSCIKAAPEPDEQEIGAASQPVLTVKRRKTNVKEDEPKHLRSLFISTLYASSHWSQTRF